MINPQTKIADLDLPYFSVIAEDIFLLPPPTMGQGFIWESMTVEEFSQHAAEDCDRVLGRLTQLTQWAQNCFWNPSLGTIGETIDVSLYEPIEKQVLWLYHLPIGSWFKQAKSEEQNIIFTSDDPRRTYSAVMYFRSHGLKHCYCIAAS